MLTVYGIPSCDTCRRANQYLTDSGVEFRFHDLRADGLNVQMLERWSDRLGWERILNKRSLSWRKVPEADRNDMNRDKAIAAMLDQPTLIKRPVFEHDEYMAVGFSEKRFEDFMERSTGAKSASG